MTVAVSISSQSDPARVAQELHEQTGCLKPTFVLFFASTKVPAEALALELRARFGEVASMGCTSSGEMSHGQMHDGSTVLMACDADSVREAWVDRANSPAEVNATLERLAEKAGVSPGLWSPEDFAGLVLHDGLRGVEEGFMARLCELTNVPFVGGSAGDDLQFERTVCFCNFKPCTDASVLALVAPTRGYRVLKTQSFRVSEKVLRATEVEPGSRRVKTFNGRPATVEYAHQLGIPVEDVAKHFRANPVGVVVGEGEPFVRGMQRADGTDIVFFCEILQGSDVHLLQAKNIVEDTRADLAATLKGMRGCSALIDFDCVERRAALKDVDALEPYGALFRDLPAVGFSTYGESYIAHINQTATMLLFE